MHWLLNREAVVIYWSCNKLVPFHELGDGLSFYLRVLWPNRSPNSTYSSWKLSVCELVCDTYRGHELNTRACLFLEVLGEIVPPPHWHLFEIKPNSDAYHKQCTDMTYTKNRSSVERLSYRSQLLDLHRLLPLKYRNPIIAVSWSSCHHMFHSSSVIWVTFHSTLRSKPHSAFYVRC